jgi:AcrR family transcriptional regulator
MNSSQPRSVKSREPVEVILRAAHELLAFEGYPSFTIRNIAKQAGISVGNVQYYFQSKNALLQELLLFVTERYNREYRRVFSKTADTPKDRFYAFIDFLLSDMTEPLRRGFFFQVWALTPSDNFVEECMEQSFARYRAAVAELISELMPSLSSAELDKRASAIQSLIEGTQLSLTKKADRFVHRSGIRALVKDEAYTIATIRMR